MKKSEQNVKEMNSKLVPIVVVFALVFGVLGGIISGKLVSGIFIAVSSAICCVTLYLVTAGHYKKVIKQFSNDIEVFKNGDFSHMIEPKKYGVLGFVASVVNAVISDIRQLIESFFSLSMSILQASRKVSGTAENASSAIEEIAKTIDEIAKGASSQAAEAQVGVEVVDKLSDQINFVYESYSGITNETTKISSLNTVGLKSVNVLREK